ncbi:28S ribosomal protein S26, mitochondrial-like [Dendronephthya gigantea]|uniref:28S ribosomal protein S26, mitochondrial-like n=1 Tax=Dendronephthya gigantea TaxID=151771 RepID=UPI00106CD379|nr:28S ribosomal protein S26, mitochondrial-like [Dendronephthya gigantea]
MAARLYLKRAKLFAKFPLISVPRTFCIAAAEAEKPSQDIPQRRKRKEKDLSKVLAYEQYRENVQKAREIFRAEHEKREARERRRIEEINKGSFSPYEQHKKAVEDIKKYNEEKEIARESRQKERHERMKIHLEKQKATSDAEQREKNRELVLKVIEESKSFVTMENLEEKIREVLETETNYNFALTAQRKMIISREPPNNLGVHGPGPAAYQRAGLTLPRTRSDSWKTRLTIEDGDVANNLNTTESSESSDSDSETSDDEKDSER